MTTWHMANKLGANVAGMKWLFFFFFFLNLEKQRGSQNTIKKLADDKKFTDQTHCRTHQIIL